MADPVPSPIRFGNLVQFTSPNAGDNKAILIRTRTIDKENSMLRSSVQAVSPDIQRLIDDIINEETRFMLRERRDSTRKAISRTARVRPCNKNGEGFGAITRDISNQGVGLVSQVEWTSGQMASIEINRTKGRPSVVIAECRWCDKFADGWFVSGWNFIRVETS